ncbi:hypothetical protein [Novosphingobium album (ex Liu et al. 2023)]|uniref:Gasdermin bGSDM n=1 Tax=Novosphingobium album (ex Liu et al. 2023) TaxID=3031130 RepID=A0ABT5WR29_9SPHN|nr:hypothetical protein [Novosphingobium album (ex Liu et al. 2023)]MDE8652510.1 hypothetical protein [Novosphingobium album (ex Liu et al. 2023)]
MGIFKNCKDPTLTALKKQGFNVVQVPRVNLLPTQLLVGVNGRLRYMGDLTSVFVPDPQGAPIPPIGPDQPGPNISGTKSADVGIGVGLDILGGLISALGGSTLGINVAYAKAASVQFEYAATQRSDTQIALVDQFLASSTINPFARSAKAMLDADQVYVVTSVIKSDTINVSAKDSNKVSLAVNVPVIQNAIGGKLSVTASGDAASVVTYKGPMPLVFGFQAVRLIFDGAVYRTMKLVEAGTVTGEAVGGAPIMLDVEQMLLADG